MNHNLLVGQSGGPTAVINGSLYGVVSEGLANPEIDNVIGMINGIEGFLADHTMDMAPLKENGELERIRTTPGSYLGSSVINYRKIFLIRFILNFSRNLPKKKSAISSIWAEMILWIP